MEFRDLKKQYEVNKEVIDGAIADVLNHADYISGRAVKKLEQELADYVGVKHCVSCANGTDALQLALMVWEIGKGDAVFVPDFTFFSTAEVVALVGATPIFVDVDLDTFNMDSRCLERSIKKVLDEGQLKPKVVIAVDLFGLPADYVQIRKITDKYNLLLLEDGAQGFGGCLDGKRACSFGDISTTSFFPAKPLGGYGDGGAVFTENDTWAELLSSYRVHGKGKDKYDNVRIGMNSRLDTLQAAILIEKLQMFKNFELEQCNIIADEYTKQLESVVSTPVVPKGMTSSWAQYTIKLESKEVRDMLQKELKNQGVPSMIYYAKPLHEQMAFKELRHNKEELKVTTLLCETVLSLPMHPYLTSEEIEYICNNVSRSLNN